LLAKEPLWVETPEGVDFPESPIGQEALDALRMLLTPYGRGVLKDEMRTALNESAEADQILALHLVIRAWYRTALARMDPSYYRGAQWLKDTSPGRGSTPDEIARQLDV
jgi:hypothetical protein